jgi:hypothetical protein
VFGVRRHGPRPREGERAMSAPMDLREDGTLRNMYDCTACPKCGSTYRVPFAETIICDDCGHHEPWDDYLRAKLTEEEST